MSFDLSDYVDVAERLTKFYERFPDGRIAATSPRVETIGDKVFIAVTASVYRTENDPQPCVGSAWEAFPGKTPYTRDSEAMNAETSAVGRALALAGIEARRAISSRDEVQARRESAPKARKSAASRADSTTVTDAQMKRLHALFNASGISNRDDRLMYVVDVIRRQVESSKDLTKDEASRVMDALQAHMPEGSAA